MINLDKTLFSFHNYPHMSRINEMKNREIIENKPYLTRVELSILLEKTGKNLNKKISRLIKDGYLVPLKNGLYTTKVYLLQAPKNLPEFISNILYYPSYLSLEYVLQTENLIPESVMVYTAVTDKITRFFKNGLGQFSYRKIKNPLFCGYQEVDFWQNYKIKIATPAKALFDFLYLKKFGQDLRTEILVDLRINFENLFKKDLEEFAVYAAMAKSPKMERVLKILKTRI